jgi:hypothetical protein
MINRVLIPIIIILFLFRYDAIASQELSDNHDGIIFKSFSNIAEIILEKPNLELAGFQANISMIINTSGTFTSFYNLIFLQNDKIISKQSHHSFYVPTDIPIWSEYFNISNFYYQLHSDDPSAHQISLTWQYGIPPRQGSTYGTRGCDNTNWACIRRNCYGCPWTFGWHLWEGHLNCSGEGQTWIYDDNGMGCSNENRSIQILCGDRNEGILILEMGIPGRRKFSFWTVAKHRFRKLFGRVGR